jgi:hypothetical protein
MLNLSNRRKQARKRHSLAYKAATPGFSRQGDDIRPLRVPENRPCPEVAASHVPLHGTRHQLTGTTVLHHFRISARNGMHRFCKISSYVRIKSSFSSTVLAVDYPDEVQRCCFFFKT